jgi:GxxExxY protein
VIEAAELNRISGEVLNAAMAVHSELGPGLLESAYMACLAHELTIRGLQLRTQMALPLVYRGIRLDAGYRIDVLVQQEVIVEIKAVEKLLPIHEAQLLCYLKLSQKRLGLIINFNSVHLRDGIRRMVRGL